MGYSASVLLGGSAYPISVISGRQPATSIYADGRSSDRYRYSNYTAGFAVYNGMASALDSLVANLTTTLQAKGMWADTLLVFSSDNGGPSQLGKECNASNWPVENPP